MKVFALLLLATVLAASHPHFKRTDNQGSTTGTSGCSSGYITSSERDQQRSLQDAGYALQAYYQQLIASGCENYTETSAPSTTAPNPCASLTCTILYSHPAQNSNGQCECVCDDGYHNPDNDKRWTACEPNSQTTGTSNNGKRTDDCVVDQCSGMICDEHATCYDGDCMCNSGYLAIPKNGGNNGKRWNIYCVPFVCANQTTSTQQPSSSPSTTGSVQTSTPSSTTGSPSTSTPTSTPSTTQPTDETPDEFCPKHTNYPVTMPGYFCTHAGDRFYQCNQDGETQEIMTCPAGTYCPCTYGVECSENQTRSPCITGNGSTGNTVGSTGSNQSNQEGAQANLDVGVSVSANSGNTFTYSAVMVSLCVVVGALILA